MKTQSTHHQILFLLVSLAMASACATTKNTAEPEDNRPVKIVDNGYELVPADNVNQSNVMVHPNKDHPSNLSLSDMVRRMPGVQVSGNGPYARITVNGVASYMAGTDPLFVVNGQEVGTNFSTVYSLVNPNDVISMSVLKGPDATIYGSRGANGVILIRTK